MPLGIHWLLQVPELPLPSCMNSNVEVLDAKGRAQPGLEHSSAVPLRGRSSTGRQRLARWKEGGASLPRRLLGTEVRLRFMLRGAAKLYGFAVSDNVTLVRLSRRATASAITAAAPAAAPAPATPAPAPATPAPTTSSSPPPSPLSFGNLADAQRRIPCAQLFELEIDRKLFC